MNIFKQRKVNRAGAEILLNHNLMKLKFLSCNMNFMLNSSQNLRFCTSLLWLRRFWAVGIWCAMDTITVLRLSLILTDMFYEVIESSQENQLPHATSFVILRCTTNISFPRFKAEKKISAQNCNKLWNVCSGVMFCVSGLVRRNFSSAHSARCNLYRNFVLH